MHVNDLMTKRIPSDDSEQEPPFPPSTFRQGKLSAVRLQTVRDLLRERTRNYGTSRSHALDHMNKSMLDDSALKREMYIRLGSMYQIIDRIMVKRSSLASYVLERLRLNSELFNFFSIITKKHINNLFKIFHSVRLSSILPIRKTGKNYLDRVEAIGKLAGIMTSVNFSNKLHLFQTITSRPETEEILAEALRSGAHRRLVELLSSTIAGNSF